MACTEGDLFRLWEVFVNIAVELHLSNVADGNLILGPDLGGVEDVEVEVVLVFLGDELDTELPLRIGAIVDGFVQILAMEIRVLTSKLESFIPHQGVDAQLWGPDELHEGSFTLSVDQRESVDTESLHHSIRSGSASVRHSPEKHVSRLFV